MDLDLENRVGKTGNGKICTFAEEKENFRTILRDIAMRVEDVPRVTFEEAYSGLEMDHPGITSKKNSYISIFFPW